VPVVVVLRVQSILKFVSRVKKEQKKNILGARRVRFSSLSHIVVVVVVVVVVVPVVVVMIVVYSLYLNDC
jgi:hypothetical protein